MARHFDNVKDINDEKGLWKIAIRVADVWTVVNKSNEEHLEMVLMDAKGDRIRVVVPKEDVGAIKTKLIEQNIIGAIHKMDYSQPKDNPKKAAFTLTDASGKLINCTLWDNYATKFNGYWNGRSHSGHVIIILTHAKIKQAQGKYVTSVSNYWIGSKLLINEDIVEVQNFRNSLPAKESQVQSSQMLSQFSGSSQFSDLDRLMYQAQLKSIAQMNALKEDTTCVTVGTTGKFIVSKNGWSYEGCTSCTKKVTKVDVGYKCQNEHYSDKPVPRYKLEIRVYHNKDSAKFVFWDSDCAKILGKSALELTTKMFADDEDDSRAYPVDLDDILKKKFAYKVRFQANCKQASVIKVEDDPEKIQKILEQIEPEEHTSKVDNDKSDVNEDLHFHTQSLSATAEHDPDTLASVTPAKRMSTDVQCDGMLSQEVETGQLSSTKLTKQIKTE